ncbi:GPW/gp25 family protein [Micromonospora sp. BQ11]|uniref:GPW/gp25 family protein n=1 Tax=Micromonospora sp. BQ11 TaxID=3452212 RepID=UPI003F8B553F
MNVGFPYRFDATGRTAAVDDETHVKDMIAQVLFTSAGERVMRPDFGSGLLALTFEPHSFELAATTQFLVQASLQQWLGHLIAVESVEVSGADGTLRVSVDYVIRRTRQRRTDQFTAPGAAA